MHATKRKFNALLQGIGARPNPSAQSPSDAPNGSSSSIAPISGAAFSSDLSTMPFLSTTASSISSDILKKRRVGAAPTTAPSRDGLTPAAAQTPGSAAARGSEGSSTIPRIILRKASGVPLTKDNTSLSTPRYCPGDRDQLLRRLATFQELTDWTPKPDRVNEIEWAKRGWVCQGKERVRCTLCNKELAVGLNRKEVDGEMVPVLVASEIEETLVDKYVELIVASHQDDCLWRKAGSDDHLIRLPLANPKPALEGLRQRYDELCARKDFLPYEFNLRLPESLDLDAVLKDLPPNFFSEPPPPSTSPKISHPNRAALALALMGWQGLINPKIGAVPNSASCHTCLRRLGLWMFKSKEVDTETNTVLVPAMMDHLDPLREHRFFCPWKNGDVQRNPGGRSNGTPKKTNGSVAANPAGWEVLALVVRNDAILRRRRGPTISTSSLGSRLLGHKGSKSVGGQPTTTQTAKTAPTTPTRPTTSGARNAEDSNASLPLLGPDMVAGADEEAEDDEATRNAKDKERWARLRRVKSLFDIKGTKKLRRAMGGGSSRPGTGHSSVATPGTPAPEGQQG